MRLGRGSSGWKGFELRNEITCLLSKSCDDVARICPFFRLFSSMLNARHVAILV
jgi:hypothetical protein